MRKIVVLINFSPLDASKRVKAQPGTIAYTSVVYGASVSCFLDFVATQDLPANWGSKLPKWRKYAPSYKGVEKVRAACSLDTLVRHLQELGYEVREVRGY